MQSEEVTLFEKYCGFSGDSAGTPMHTATEISVSVVTVMTTTTHAVNSATQSFTMMTHTNTTTVITATTAIRIYTETIQSTNTATNLCLFSTVIQTAISA